MYEGNKPHPERKFVEHPLGNKLNALRLHRKMRMGILLGCDKIVSIMGEVAATITLVSFILT